MSQLSPAMEAALQRVAPIMFVAVEIATPDGALRLLDGSSEVGFGGRLFRGEDPDFGALASIEPLVDGTGDEAPSLRFVVNCPTLAAAGRLAGPRMQGSQVLLWIGTLNPASGTVDGDPFLAFAGEVDVPTYTAGQAARAVTLDCVSIWERLFEDWEGVRLSNAFHQSVWPGELGLEFVTGVTRTLPWGSDAARPEVVRDALDMSTSIR